MTQRENRIYSMKEFRAVDNAKEKVIEGHAAIFNQYTQIGDVFYEVIEYGAFDNADLSDVALFVNHDTGRIPLARSRQDKNNNTMTLTIDNIGLAIRAILDTEHNQQAADLYSAVARGDMSGMSFAFSVADEEWQDLKSEMPTRRIKRIKKVYEVSACTYPAYAATDISARVKSTLEAAKRKAATDEEELARLKKEIMEKYGMTNEKDTPRADYAVFGAAFKDANKRDSVQSPYNVFGELRSVTVRPPNSSASKIAVPSYSAGAIEPAFPVVSTLIDSVTTFSLHGGESFRVPYVEGFDDAYYTDEAANSAVLDAKFSYAELNQCKISAFAEFSEELEKLPNAPYADMIFQIIRTAMRKAITKEILFGQGISEDEQHHRIMGIFKSEAIDPATDLSISQITDTLLDDILLKYGADTDIEQPATLILSKQDLIAFSKARTSIKSKLYEIVYTSGNTGRINGVPFIVDANLPAISDVETQSGQYCMCFGNPRNYTLVEFSPLTISKTIHYKFPEGLVCFRGVAHVGGNVTKRNGFLRISRK